MSAQSQKTHSIDRPNEPGRGYFMNALLVVFLGIFFESIGHHIAITQRDDKDYSAALIAQLMAYLLLAVLLGGGTIQEFDNVRSQGSLLYFALGIVCAFFAVRAVYIMLKVLQQFKELKINRK
jgi:hypothetical protein